MVDSKDVRLGYLFSRVYACSVYAWVCGSAQLHVGRYYHRVWVYRQWGVDPPIVDHTILRTTHIFLPYPGPKGSNLEKLAKIHIPKT